MNQQKILLTILLLTAFGCGSKDQPVSSRLPESSPITADRGTEQQTIQLGQAITQIEMNHKEMETIFETRDVPSTCTRVVQSGTRTECHTENDRQCRDVSFPVCRNESENVCVNVPDRVCHTEQFPVCQSIPRRVCESVQKCETVNDQVCHGTPPNQSCTTVPRRVCHAEQECRTESDQVCHTESRERCEQVNRPVCHTETHQSCHNETRQECTNVPRQSCMEVPVTTQQQYPCMQPEQVPVGERLSLHTLAQVRINLLNPRNLDVSQDQLIVTMNQGMISAVARSAKGIQYQIREVSHYVNRISDTEEVITEVLEVTAMY